MIIGSQILDDGTLIISYYDALGKIQTIKKKLPEHELFNWVESNIRTQHKNWDGKFIKKKKERGRYINQFRIQEIIKDKFTDAERAIIYNIDNFPKKVYLDIEIKLTDDSFPEPDKAAMPVGLISFCGDDNITYVLSIMDNDEYPEGLKASDIIRMESEIKDYFNSIVPLQEKDAYLFKQDFKVKHKYFKTEKEMLTFFFHKLVPKFSFLTGWNFTGFDWKYLMNRAKNIKIDALKYMPSDSAFSKNKIPTHLGILDYMEVFQTVKPYKVVENYKLDYIASLVLNAHKLKHKYSSFFEFQKDAYLYTIYNVIDTLLVKLIEQRLSLLDVAFAMANVANVEINKVYSPVYVTEILICREFLSRGLRMMKLPWNSEKPPTAKYKGAYVMPPIPGFYNYVTCYDFSSMYPNIQIQFNISPDSYLGKKGEIKTDGTEIYTKNDTYFNNKEDSAVRNILTDLYNKRVATQSQMKKLYGS
jgi:DNA polymerase elongation subunit (family B)